MNERATILPEIQALRAVAVLLVVVYHLWPKHLSGGYVGVDAFFVISGFLITAHLFREVDRTGTVSLSQFWARRARRLLPASLLVLGASILGTYLLAPATLWAQFLRELTAACLYCLNFVLAVDAVDYLAADNLASPAQHYWSLSAEEQFYFVWPGLILCGLFFGKKLGAAPRRATFWTLSVLCVASFVFSLYATRKSPSMAYFITPTRAWEFGAGGLLALVPYKSARPELRALTGWLGLGALSVAAFRFSRFTDFPGYAALLPVLGTLAVLWSGAPELPWAATRWMKIGPVRYLGDVSYSLYLWHWPLIVLLPQALSRDATNLEKVAIFAGSTLLAHFTKRYVEDPGRQSPALVNRSAWVTFSASAALMSLVLAACGAMALDLTRRSTEVRPIALALKKGPIRCHGAAAFNNDGSPCKNPALDGVLIPEPLNAKKDAAARACMVQGSHLRVCYSGARAGREKKTIALLGDSHAAHWLPALRAVAKRKKWRIVSMLKGSCPYNQAPRHTSRVNARECRTWNREVREEMQRHPEVSAVFVSASAGNRFGSKASDDWIDIGVQGYLDAWAALPATVKDIYVLRDVPLPRVRVIDCLEGLGSTEARLAFGACARPSADALLPDPAARAALIARPRVKLLDLSDRFCREGICSPVVGHSLVYSDSHHMTGSFARSLAPYLERALQARPAAARRGLETAR